MIHRRPRTTAIVGGVLIALALSGCATQRHDPEPVTEPLVVEPSPTATTPPPPPAVSTLPLQSYTGTFSDSAGFKQTVTVTVAPVVLGSDSAKLAAAWTQVGGKGAVPCANAHPERTGNANFVLKSDFAGFAVGTVRIVNDVPDFPAKAWTYQFTGLQWDGSSMGVAFSTGNRCEALNAGFMLTPKWVRATDWGAVPIVFAIPDYRSPANPQGDPAKLQKPIRAKLNLGTSTPPLEFTLQAAAE
jgi:hypothetical protein